MLDKTGDQSDVMSPLIELGSLLANSMAIVAMLWYGVRYINMCMYCLYYTCTRMQHFGCFKEDFGIFSQNSPVTYFVIRIRK